jgi:succinoglycan biosynthesis protein ExoA
MTGSAGATKHRESPRVVPQAEVAPAQTPVVPAPPAEDAAPSVSVVLPVLNEGRDIGRLLREVLDQEPPPGGFEVIVADGGSTDRTRDIVAALGPTHPNLMLVDNPRRLSSAGRNVGAQAARGRYIVFLDGHCSVPRRDYLLRLCEVFQSTGAACLCRSQPLQNMAEGSWGRAIAAARHSILGHDPGSDIYGGDPAFTDPRSAGAAYARDVFARLGGYDERFDACEDVEFNHRVGELGYRAYRHPDLAVDYRPRRSLRSFFRQMRRYGRGRARLMARHPGATPWSLLGVTFLSIAWILGAPLLGWKTALTTAMLGAAAWLLLVAIESIRVAGLSRATYRVGAALAVIHSGLVLGFWRGLAEVRRYRRPRGLVRAGEAAGEARRGR